jgi:pimeloyl-ACP methyl ester carboxylesterase
MQPNPPHEVDQPRRRFIGAATFTAAAATLGAGRAIAAPASPPAAFAGVRQVAAGPLEATFQRSATAFANPDYVDIVIHNYRWRLGLADGERAYDDLEAKLAGAPTIAVPTITLEGDANGAPHPDPSAYARKFTGPYAHRLITGGVGHNLPQEAPAAFAQAIHDAARL